MIPDPEFHDYYLEPLAYTLEDYPEHDPPQASPLTQRLQSTVYALLLILMIAVLVFFVHLNSVRELGLGKGALNLSSQTTGTGYLHPTGPTPTFTPYPIPSGISAEVRWLIDHPVVNPRSVPIVREYPNLVDVLAILDPGQTPSYHVAQMGDHCEIQVGGQLTQIGMDELTGYVLVYYSPPPGKSTRGVPCDGSSDPTNGDGEGIEVFFVPAAMLR